MILGDEHEDCENWGRWCRSLHFAHLGYRNKWSLPDGLDWHMDDDKHASELERMEWKDVDERRAVATDGLFRIWLDRYRVNHDYVAKRHFRILRATYFLRMHLGELEVREALRALGDLKQAQLRRAA